MTQPHPRGEHVGNDQREARIIDLDSEDGEVGPGALSIPGPSRAQLLIGSWWWRLPWPWPSGRSARGMARPGSRARPRPARNGRRTHQRRRSLRLWAAGGERRPSVQPDRVGWARRDRLYRAPARSRCVGPSAVRLAGSARRHGRRALRLRLRRHDLRVHARPRRHNEHLDLWPGR